MKTAIYRQSTFNAAHRLHRSDWTLEQNLAFFGPCAMPNFHGHNYKIEVKVSGEVDSETGFVMDLKVLADLIKEQVEEKFDHRNLNLDTEEFKYLNPTAENIARVIYDLLRPHIKPELELMIRLFETPRNFVEYPAG